MAFKLDFNKLANQDPAEAEARREAEYKNYLETLGKIIETRRAMVEAILQHEDKLNDWERGFMKTLRHFAEDHDIITGQKGGELSYLSDSRLESLQKIHARLHSPAPGYRVIR